MYFLRAKILIKATMQFELKRKENIGRTKYDISFLRCSKDEKVNIKSKVVLSVKLIYHHINRNWIKKLFTFQIDPRMTDLKSVVSLALPSISELLSLN